ncbi:MAG: metal ABC transporter substrate-binding protein [Dehalococcoidia bacterium]|nr:metal ABC transporter substrate-binding protein [Dehalococcoidia bacterium]
MNRVSFLTAFLVIGLIAVLVGCQAAPPAGLRVVAGTTQLTTMVREVGGDRVSVTNFVPAGTCPGQADVKPGDIEAIRRASVLIIHDYQEAQRDVKALLEAAGNPNLIIRVIAAKGGLMTPAYQTEATDKVATALAELDPANADFYRQRAASRKVAVSAKAEEVKQRLGKAAVQGTKVISMLHQADFMRWAGFDVIATYGPPETFTPSLLADLVSKGKAAKVVLVVDNLQSGPDAGKGVAREIGAAHVTLSNFPGALPNTDTWEKAVDENVRLVLAALKK